MKKELKKKKNSKGFTLVEMIVVIAIIGVLAAMMVPSLLGYIDKANTSNNVAAVTNVVRTAQTALAELNDTTTTEITGVPNASADKGVDVVAINTDGTAKAALEKAIEDLYKNEKFKGTFKITVSNGVVQKAVYDCKGTKDAPDINVTSESTKQYGYYQ
ncbi:MAG: type II secretion system GspH family protein [Candidatus Niameybacter stercoravium]|nr:type II secretion system GspH family protein [Candidatus Niameybacter stercoravium]